MRPLPQIRLAIVVCLLIGSAHHGQSIGPDLIIDAFPGVQNFAHDTVSGLDGFSFATTICNVGAQAANWVAGTSAHPIWAFQIYRLHDGRFEQIGMSWARHAFFALGQNACGTCPPNSFGSILGPGCSDESTASLNGSQFQLGPRGEVTAGPVSFPFPPTSPALTGSLDRRLRAPIADLTVPGARYFLEGVLLAQDDWAAGASTNNATWCEIALVAVGGGVSAYILPGTTHPGEPALYAWRDADPQVTISTLDLPGDGRLLTALRVTGLSSGAWRTDVAVQNLDSSDGVRAVGVESPSGAVTQIRFHDVDYHSGEIISGADWTAQVVAHEVVWSTASAVAAPNGNALRWGTTYSFGFESALPPPNVVQVALTTFQTDVQHVQLMTVPDRLVIISGDQQVTGSQRPFPMPLIVRVESLAGVPQAGVGVNFAVASGPAVLTSPTMQVTDSQGLAYLGFAGGTTGGPVSLEAATPSSVVTISGFVRHYQTAWSPSAGALALDLVTDLAFQPLIFALDLPQPSLPTPFGPVCTSALSPLPSLILVSGMQGIGAFDPTLTTDASGHWFEIVFGLGPLAGTGLMLASQIYALAPNLPLPQSVLVSNCRTITFF